MCLKLPFVERLNGSIKLDLTLGYFDQTTQRRLVQQTKKLYNYMIFEIDDFPSAAAQHPGRERNAYTTQKADCRSIVNYGLLKSWSWATQYLYWIVNKRRNIILSVEFRFSLHNPDRRIIVYKRHSCAESNFIDYGWDFILSKNRTPYVRLSITEHQNVCYRHIIWGGDAISSIDQRTFYLMFENARSHVANGVQRYLYEAGRQTLRWPVRN